MFNKIQMIVMAKTSISNNRISRLKKFTQIQLILEMKFGDEPLDKQNKKSVRTLRVSMLS